MGYIDIRFEFDEVEEDDYTYYDLSKISRLDTDIPDDARDGIVETLAQSDEWAIEDMAKILGAME